jgi:hypothetical protein
MGPFMVLERLPKYFKLAVGASKENMFIDRLKVHLGQAPVQAAQPPKRGVQFRVPGEETEDLKNLSLFIFKVEAG